MSRKKYVYGRSEKLFAMHCSHGTNIMDHLEIEVKFPVDDADVMRSAITTLGCRSRGRVFETNFCYDDVGHSLMRKKALLRLRNDTRARLTFKSPPGTEEPGFKVFREMEVQLDSFDTMAGILEAVGFQRTRVYEKWRETFACGDVQLCLDTLPMGSFLEIEGPRREIAAVSRKLNLRWEKRILANYLEMFDHLRRQLDLPFSDLTFDNFKGICVDPGWPRAFAAGS